MMKILKCLTGFLALILTFVGISLIAGQFVPSINEVELSILQHIGYTISGAMALAGAITLWLWSTKISNPK